jgi:hypothetical protein
VSKTSWCSVQTERVGVGHAGRNVGALSAVGGILALLARQNRRLRGELDRLAERRGNDRRLTLANGE